MYWKISILLISLGLSTSVFAQTNAYDLTINNQAVVFTFINKTCNGGRIDQPPQRLPLGPTQFNVQSDAQQGCMLRYDDGKGHILGIWIHQQQVECSHPGSIGSYDCKFAKDVLTINP